jgi:hypothetical protein
MDVSGVRLVHVLVVAFCVVYSWFRNILHKNEMLDKAAGSSYNRTYFTLDDGQLGQNV